MLIVSSAAFSNVNDKEKKENASKTVTVVQNTNQKFKLVYLEQNQGMVRVNIKNGKGTTVYTQSVENQSGFAQQYNFENLPYGEYTFEVTGPDGSKLVKKVRHKADIVKPEIKADLLNVNDDKKFRLAVLKYNENPVNVKIYNDQNELIHSETIKSKESFRKTFDLTEVDGESFRFDLKNKNSTISVSAE